MLSLQQRHTCQFLKDNLEVFSPGLYFPIVFGSKWLMMLGYWARLLQQPHRLRCHPLGPLCVSSQSATDGSKLLVVIEYSMNTYCYYKWIPCCRHRPSVTYIFGMTLSHALCSPTQQNLKSLSNSRFNRALPATVIPQYFRARFLVTRKWDLVRHGKLTSNVSLLCRDPFHSVFGHLIIITRWAWRIFIWFM